MLQFITCSFKEAICALKEVIRVAPNFSDPYHLIGMIYTDLNDTKKALNFYMIAAHLTSKDAYLWKLLVDLSMLHGDIWQAIYCCRKALIADPDDTDLWFLSAKFYLDLGEYKKGADSYKQISCLSPEGIEALRSATQLCQICGQHELAKRMLEGKLHVDVANFGVVDLLASVLMERNEYDEALKHIERAQRAYATGEQIPLDLITKAGICHVHLGHLEKAEAYFSVLKAADASSTHPHLIVDVADSLMSAGHYESASKYYMMLEENSD